MDLLHQIWTPGAGIAFAVGLSAGFVLDQLRARLGRTRP